MTPVSVPDPPPRGTVNTLDRRNDGHYPNPRYLNLQDSGAFKDIGCRELILTSDSRLD